MSKLDNNSKLIVSKYLIGKDFTDFVNTFNLHNYYHTTFKYIIVNYCDAVYSFGSKTCISNSMIEKVMIKLNDLPNLNEILLNFVCKSNFVNDKTFNIIVKYYIKFQKLNKSNKNIKINIVNNKYNDYKEIFVEPNDIDEKFYTEYILVPHAKQKVYIVVNNYINEKYESLLDEKYNLIFDCHNLNMDKINEYSEICKKYNINYSIGGYCGYNIKFKTISDKYFDVYKNVFVDIKQKYRQLNFPSILKDINMYCKIFKIKHENLDYLNDYITCASEYIDILKHSNEKYNTFYYSNIVDFYKYGVKNIYSDIMQHLVVLDKLDIAIKIKHINVNNYLRCVKFKQNYYLRYYLYNEINRYVRY